MTAGLTGMDPNANVNVLRRLFVVACENSCPSSFPARVALQPGAKKDG